MQKNQYAYGVLLPLKFRDRFVDSARCAMAVTMSTVAINLAAEKDPTGTRRGTIISNPRDDSDAYAGLVFRGHLCWATSQIEVIAHELVYRDLFSVNLSRAERMIGLLRKIRDAEKKLPVRPTDLGQYVALLAPTVGIKYMVTAEDQDTENRNSYPDGWYRILPVRDAQLYIQNLVTEVKETYLPIPPSQV